MMRFKTVFYDLNLNKDDKKYLFALLLFSIVLLIYMIQFHQVRGAFNPDIYAYLAGAIELSGLNFHNLS